MRLLVAAFALLAIPAVAMPAGRLTLTSGNAAPESDQVSNTVYLAMVEGNGTELWDGSAWTGRTYPGDMSLALGSTAPGNYDAFDYWDGSALRFCRGPAWASNTSRGTGAGTTEIAAVDGRMVNAVSMTCTNGGSSWTVPAHYGLLRGGFRVYYTGYTQDAADTRLLWDLYRPRLLPVSRIEATESWTYSTATFRQVNASTANRIAIFNGVAGRPAFITASGHMLSLNGVAMNGYVGIGMDSTTVDSGKTPGACSGGNTFPILSCLTIYSGFPGIGYHELNWLEKGSGTANVQTWIGNGGNYQTGMVGSVLQ